MFGLRNARPRVILAPGFTAVVVLACAILLAGATPAFARTFNPRLVLSDLRMREAPLSQAEIQAFLAKRPGLLDGMSFPRHENGSIASASTIIWESAQAWNISPKVLLTMLQKEQSLLTRTRFAKNTLSRAVGAGCPNSYTNRYPGFGNQLWNCGRMLDGYGETSKTTNYVPNPWVPGMANSFTGWVHTDSLATYKLYVYNPSIGAKAPYGDLSTQSCSGNANFWKIFWGYFGDPMATPGARGGPMPLYRVNLSTQYARRPWNRSVELTGVVVSASPTVTAAGLHVRLDQFVNGAWQPVNSAAPTVAADGSWAFTLGSANLRRVRVRLDATGATARVGNCSPYANPSGCFVMDAAATLTTPTVVGTPVSTRTTTFVGKLGPAHIGRISVVLYHKVGTSWVYSRTVRFNTLSTGAWGLHVSLGKGAWKVRASHQDTQHALGTSPWCYTTVH